jgi:hypothetical protein
MIREGGTVSKKIRPVLLFFLALTAFPVASNAGLSFRFYGGGAYLRGGDINDGMKGWTDYWKANYQQQGYPTQSGSFNPVNYGYTFGGDIIIHLTARLGIGLGAEFLQASKSSTLTFQSPSTTINWTIVGKPSAVPVKASLFYVLPLGSRAAISLHAGAGYYSANARMESHLKTSSETSYLIDSSAKGVGYHAGLGLELKLFPKVFFLIEGAGRYVVLSGFEGNVTMLPEGGWKGKLYYWGASTSYLSRFNYIDLLAGAPNSTGYIFFREAKIDYSGFSLRAGFVIKL